MTLSLIILWSFLYGGRGPKGSETAHTGRCLLSVSLIRQPVWLLADDWMEFNTLCSVSPGSLPCRFFFAAALHLQRYQLWIPCFMLCASSLSCVICASWPPWRGQTLQAVQILRSPPVSLPHRSVLIACFMSLNRFFLEVCEYMKPAMMQ